MRNTDDLNLSVARSDPHSARERLLSLSLASERKRRKLGVAIIPRDRPKELASLSYAQERLWFLDQIGLVGATYNMPLALRLSGDLDEGALERSFLELVRRHESLRTRFGLHNGVPHQVIDPPGHFELRREDLSEEDLRDRDQRLREWMEEQESYRFNLSTGPLFLVLLVKLGSNENALLVTMHHIVSDGWSLGVLVREISTLYAAYAQGRPSPLPELPVQYADYALWQRQWLQGELLQTQLQYWRERVVGAPPQLQLPTDRPRPAVESFKGALLKFELSGALRGGLEELARREGVTLFMVMLAAYQVLLSRWSGQQDIVVGSPIAGRTHGEVEALIGFFVNMLPLRTDLSGDPTFRELLQQVKETTLGAYAHQDLPFEKLVAELRPERNLTRQPIFQVALALQNLPQEHLSLAGLDWASISTDYSIALFDLTLYLAEVSEGLLGTFEYASDLFDRETIDRVASHFQILLEGIITDPDCHVA